LAGRCSACIQEDCGTLRPPCTCVCHGFTKPAPEAKSRYDAILAEADPDSDLESMGEDPLRAEVKRLRAGIRKHRDSSGHDLCWYVPELWNLLPDKIEPKPEVPSREAFLHRCGTYRDSLEPAKNGVRVGNIVQHKKTGRTGRVSRFADPEGAKIWVDHTGPYPVEDLVVLSQF